MSTKTDTPEHDLELLANQALLHAFAQKQDLRQLPAGAVLFSDAQTPAGIYVLLSGGVEMKFADGAGTVQMDSVGTILGLNAIVSGHPFDYTATATCESVVGFVPRDRFFATLSDNPSLWMHVLKVLARDIGSCYDRVRELTNRNGTRNGERRSAQPGLV